MKYDIVRIDMKPELAEKAAGWFHEKWNIDKPDEIVSIHLDYLNSGCNILKTNTFGANSLKFSDSGEYSLEKIIKAGIDNARNAIKLCENSNEHFKRRTSDSRVRR